MGKREKEEGEIEIEREREKAREREKERKREKPCPLGSDISAFLSTTPARQEHFPIAVTQDAASSPSEAEVSG